MNANATAVTPATSLSDLAPQHATTLNELAAQRLQLKQLISALESDETALKERMEKLAGDELGLTAVEYDGGDDPNKRWRFALSKGRSALSKDKLMELGVTARQIELAKVTGQGSWRLTGAGGGEATVPAESTSGNGGSEP